MVSHLTWCPRLGVQLAIEYMQARACHMVHADFQVMNVQDRKSRKEKELTACLSSV